MALAIDARFGGDDPQVRLAAQALATMPDWLEQRRLDSWETHVQSVFPAEIPNRPPMMLVEAVFEFGRYNLYTAFQPEETADEFHRLIARLSEFGLVLDERQSVSDW